MISVLGEWRSLVARLLWEQDAAGSNPVSPMHQKVSPQLTSLPLRKGRFFYCCPQVRSKGVQTPQNQSSPQRVFNIHQTPTPTWQCPSSPFRSSPTPPTNKDACDWADGQPGWSPGDLSAPWWARMESQGTSWLWNEAQTVQSLLEEYGVSEEG